MWKSLKLFLCGVLFFDFGGGVGFCGFLHVVVFGGNLSDFVKLGIDGLVLLDIEN